jgi:hypothetical protein
MSQWDRKALLLLVDDAGKSLNNPALSTSQRQDLLGLLSHYSNKAKTIHANQLDVLTMQQQLYRILGAVNTES